MGEVRLGDSPQEQGVAGITQSAGCHTLFVVLPSRETFTVRDLPSSLLVRDLCARLELVIGVPSESWSLHYGKTLLQDLGAPPGRWANAGPALTDAGPAFAQRPELVVFGETVRDCALLRITWEDEDALVCEAVLSRKSNLEELLLRQGGNGDGSTTGGNLSRLAFVAAFIAAHRGIKDIVQLIARRAPVGLLGRTQFGRTVVHAAASSDQTIMLEVLAAARCPMREADFMGDTPLQVAHHVKAFSSERTLKNLHVKSRTTSSTTDNSTKPKGILVSNNPRTNQFVIRSRGGQLGMQNTVQNHSMESSLSVYTSKKLNSPAATPRATEKRRDHSNRRVERCRTAPNRTQKHKHCQEKPDFVIFRTVPFDELKPVTVEYVPVKSTDPYENGQVGRKSTGVDCRPGKYSCPAVPYTSPCTSLENIPHNYMCDENSGRRSTQDKSVSWVDERSTDDTLKTPEARPTSGFPRGKIIPSKPRVQSASYYRTKYHIEASEDRSIPKPRPSTAGARYREWKTWLLEKYKQDAEKAKTDEERREKRRQNLKAFEKWMIKKRENGELYPQEEESDDSEEETGKYRVNEDSEAYIQWKEKKKDTFDKMDKKRKDRLRDGDRASSDWNRKRVTIFEMGDTNPGVMKEDHPASYMRAYHRWQDKKEKYEKYKERKGLLAPEDDEGQRDKDMTEKTRKTLVLDGMTYEEWLGQKIREKPTQKTTNRS